MLDAIVPFQLRKRLSQFEINPATWRQVSAPPASLPCPGLPNSAASLAAKRCFDIVAALVLLACLAPLLLAIAALVRLDSPGPAFFRQRRSGRGGSFRIAKFRTMHVHLADESGLFQTRRGDQRVTAIGGFLRRTSLDELPQLFNVLAGDMSIVVVGPRPHAPGTRAAGRELEDVDSRYTPCATGCGPVLPASRRSAPAVENWTARRSCAGGSTWTWPISASAA